MQIFTKSKSFQGDSGNTFLKKILFINLYRKGNGGRKKERETSMCGCL